MKGTTVSKQASFMANFFKKSSNNGSPSKGACHQTSLLEEGSDSGFSIDAVDNHRPKESFAHSGVSADPSDPGILLKRKRNFHPWEPPKGALVAGFPYGPGANTDFNSAFSISKQEPPQWSNLETWIAFWRACPRRNEILPSQSRDNSQPLPRMKLVQLCMMVPVTLTQLVDVDLDSQRKVVWDVEADPLQEQLKVILEESEELPDGLLR